MLKHVVSARILVENCRSFRALSNPLNCPCKFGSTVIHVPSNALKTAISNLIARISVGSRNFCADKPQRMHPVFSGQNNLESSLKLVATAANWASIHDESGKADYLVDGNAHSPNGIRSGLTKENFLDLVQVQDRVLFLSAIAECLKDGRTLTKSCRIFFKQQLNDEDALCDCELLFKPVSVQSGRLKVNRVLVVGRDVSNFVEVGRMLEEKHTVADKANIAKTQFLANMSHELRTPLNAIIGFSELLQSDVMGKISDQKQNEYIGIVNDSAHHLLSVLNDILDMSKIEASKYELNVETFDFSDVLSKTVAMLQVSADSGDVTLSWNFGNELPAISADKRAVKQVLINVISNAIKFTEPGGSVFLNVVRIGRNVKIEVTDTGIGISQHQLKNLGQPFYQADSKYNRKHEGTGLGLSVVLGLLKLHGGEIEFDSALGEGTKITILLPIVSSIAAPVPADSESEVVCLDSRSVGMNGENETVRKIA